MKKVRDLVVLDKMAENNLDIRMAKLPNSLIGVRRVKTGGKVTIGVDHDATSILINMALGEKDYGAALIIFRRDQFYETKTELVNQDTWTGRNPSSGYALLKNLFGRIIIIPEESVTDVAWTGMIWSPVDDNGFPILNQICNFSTEEEAHEYVASFKKAGK